jgi:hypothetical protein
MTLRSAAALLVLPLLVLAVMPMPAAAAPLAHREVLPNGIVLLVAERPDVPIVVARVFLKAGSVFDPADKGDRRADDPRHGQADRRAAR